MNHVCPNAVACIMPYAYGPKLLIWLYKSFISGAPNEELHTY